MAARRVRVKSVAVWRRGALQKMEATRRSTLALLSRLPEAEITRPRTQDEWSIKDILAHVSAWEDEAAKRLQLIARGRGDCVHFYHDMTEADRFNARAVAAGRRLSPGAMVRRMTQARKRLVEALRRVPPPALDDPSHEYTVIAWFPELAWTHEQGHLADIRAWWREQRAARPKRRPG